MKSFSLTQLQYLVEVARTGHFAKAAKSCFVSQPTLSMQIQKLEAELGVILLDRNKKPIEPTPIGQKVVAIARAVLSGAEQIEQVIQGERGELKGPLSLAVIPTLAPYLLPRFLGGFVKKYPLVELSIEELQTSEILKRLVENRLDVGILALPVETKGVQEEVLFQEPFLGYVSQSHPLHKLNSLSDKNITHQGLWLLNEGHCFRNQVLSLCKSRTKFDEGTKLSFESGNLETLKRLVEQNSGYTLLPWLATTQIDSKDRSKYLRPFQEPIPTREVGLATSESFVKLRMLEALRSAILESLPPELTSLKRKVRSIPL